MSVAFATLATVLLEELLVRSIFLLFLLTVLLSAWWGGRPTALLAVALSGVACAWLLPPAGSFLVTSPADLIRLGMFVVAATVMALLTGTMREAHEQARTAHRRAEEQKQALQELASRLEEQVAENRQLLERLAEGYESERAARERAELSATARAETLAVVAHDLRNPLNLIGMNAALIRDLDPPADRRARMLDAIFAALDQTERFIRDLLDAARIEAGYLNLNVGDVDIGDVVARAAAAFEPLAAHRHIDVETDLAGDLPRIAADAERILQALSNLIGNAVKFSRTGGRVVVAVRRGGRGVQIEVTDTGPGIPLEHRDRLFDRFWQGIRSDPRGTGLGLPIAKGIIEAHGGNIVVETEPGAGSTFIVELPTASRGTLSD